MVVGAVMSPALAGAAPAAAPRATGDRPVTISSNCTGFCFVPAQVTIATGDTVTWVNHSGAVHNVTRCSPAGCNGAAGGTGTDTTFTAGNVASASGATFRHTFTVPGTYRYFCIPHEQMGMIAEVEVLAGPRGHGFR